MNKLFIYSFPPWLLIQVLEQSGTLEAIGLTSTNGPAIASIAVAQMVSYS